MKLPGLWVVELATKKWWSMGAMVGMGQGTEVGFNELVPSKTGL